MLAFPDKITGIPYLWVFGGRGGDNTYNGGPTVHFNDVWCVFVFNCYSNVTAMFVLCLWLQYNTEQLLSHSLLD